MKFIPQSIPGLTLIEPKIHRDTRGYFTETYKKDLLEKALGYKIDFIQDNESRSEKFVLRGLHYQTRPFEQAKLVRVVEGSVLDVALDIRKSSPFFGKHVAVELSSENKKQLFIPSGFAHGYIVLSDTAIFSYKVDNHYSPEHERGILFDDTDLAIDWKLPKNKIKLSLKDKKYTKLKNSKNLFE